MEKDNNEKFDYFYKNDTQDFIFYRIPKMLFTDKRFSKISSEAKTLYGLLLDRMSLSAKNNWTDDQGRVYIYFTINDAMEFMNISKWKAVKLFAELDSEKGCGLISKKIQGFGKPAIIYVKNFNNKRLENSTPRSSIIEPQEVQFPAPNNTNINNNKFNNNYMCNMYNPILSNHTENMTDKIDKREYYKNIIYENITYNALKDNYGAENIDGIVELVLDAVSSNKPCLTIGGDDIPQCAVKEKFLKLNSSHIEYVLDCFNKNKSKIRNIKSYLLTSLYNSYATIDYYYIAEANHDLRYN